MCASGNSASTLLCRHGSTAPSPSSATHAIQPCLILPHLAQEAAQAIEDAAVLGVVLARMPDRDPHSVNKALRVHERLRKQKLETLIDLTVANDHELHL